MCKKRLAFLVYYFINKFIKYNKHFYFLNIFQIHIIIFFCKYIFFNDFSKRQKEDLSYFIESFASNILIVYKGRKHLSDLISLLELVSLLNPSFVRPVSMMERILRSKQSFYSISLDAKRIKR